MKGTSEQRQCASPCEICVGIVVLECPRRVLYSYRDISEGHEIKGRRRPHPFVASFWLHPPPPIQLQHSVKTGSIYHRARGCFPLFRGFEILLKWGGKSMSRAPHCCHGATGCARGGRKYATFKISCGMMGDLLRRKDGASCRLTPSLPLELRRIGASTKEHPLESRAHPRHTGRVLQSGPTVVTMSSRLEGTPQL
ncbi:hypothetical protein EYF80_015931 [Liparis tanakae]|uniref:Uncharacterized protein n=1 Tax=Liparis tanakae TaxID=230148 RepID=A0A4Z2I966_9TELE|nr:hypothetical protein EYF80_015931 [Liparis tanakae]